MPGVTRDNIDHCGSHLILGGGQSTVSCEGKLITVVNDQLQSCTAIMSTGSSTISIAGTAICRAGDTATDGTHATGSSTVSAT